MNEEVLVKTLLDSRVRLIAGAAVVLRDLHQAEDVFQEVLVRAFGTSPSSWKVIVHRSVLDWTCAPGGFR